MDSRTLTLLLIGACALCVGNALRIINPSAQLHPAVPQPPSFPASYSITYTLSLPYTAKVQPDMLVYDVTLYRDASDPTAKRARMETLNGTNVILGIAGDAEYQIGPQLDERVCKVFPGGYGAASANALPDISSWNYSGEEEVRGQQAQVWSYVSKQAAKTTTYKFYVTTDTQQPLRLHMVGQELTAGSHFGEYIADFGELIPGVPDESYFKPPGLCDDPVLSNVDNTITGSIPSRSNSPSAAIKDNDPLEAPNAAASPAALRMLRLLPMVRYGGEDSGYDLFLDTHGSERVHGSLEEYRHRLSLFSQNVQKISEHNASPSKTYTMAMNKFGDWTREEFLAVMLPQHGRLKKKESSLDSSSEIPSPNNLEKHKHHKKKDLQRNELAYEALADANKLPKTVDWRGTGADSGIKDQALCGSCWTFGAVGAMESAWFKATGEGVRFSEQQVVDCSYGYQPGNTLATNGCDGGGAWAGIGHIIDAGGISLLKDYQYLGMTDYCREDTRPKTGKFKGYARIPMGNDAALMEALYSRGPVGISMDASHDSFTFYSSGVYYEPSCSAEYDDLDHAMVLVGYGSEAGGDYWLVKNSWSTLWGDEGYIKVSRDGKGCGASTDALYAVVDDEAVAAARERLRSAESVRREERVV